MTQQKTAGVRETEPPPALEFLFEYVAELAPVQHIAGPFGTRMTAMVTGGTVNGPALTGKVLPGGGDWLVAGTHGAGRLDVRITFQADDGVLVHCDYRGVLDPPADVLERLSRGETIPEAELYFRTAPLFEVADERYASLNKVQAVGVGTLGPDRVSYRVYKVL